MLLVEFKPATFSVAVLHHYTATEAHCFIEVEAVKCFPMERGMCFAGYSSPVYPAETVFSSLCVKLSNHWAEFLKYAIFICLMDQMDGLKLTCFN